MENRVEEDHSQMVNINRSGNNNGDSDTVGNSTSAPVEQQGAIKPVHQMYNN